MNKSFESIIQSPVMKMASETQERLDSLSYGTGSIVDFSKLVDDLNPAKRWTGHAMTQDLLSQLTKNFPQNNLAISNATLEMAKNLAELSNSNTSLFESIKNNAALIDAFKATHLGLKPATQFILPEGFASKNQVSDLSSVISKAPEVFKQYEQFGELESFKAISRLRNFPFEDIVPINFTNFYDKEDSDKETIFKMDSEISSELLSAENFEDLSSEVKRSLLFIVKNNYLKTIYYLAFYICINMIINEGFSANESFTLNDLEKMIHLVYEEFGNGIIASLLAGYIAKQDNEK